MPDTTLPPPVHAGSILHRPYLWVTIGACALVFLAAFESLAVTTIMPVVSRDLDGASLYALAFAGPLATGVIGMVAAGNWSDRRGPAVPLYSSVALFVVGLLIAGTALSMPALVAGRLVQGLGGGALTVALYVVVARVYPATLHPKIFAAFCSGLGGPVPCWPVCRRYCGPGPELALGVPGRGGPGGSGPGDGRPGAARNRPGRPGRPPSCRRGPLAAWPGPRWRRLQSWA